MKVKVNRTVVEVFEGAEVRHAILSYLVRRHKSLSDADRLVVYDDKGHEIDEHAPVSQHEVIKLKYK